MVDVPGTNIDFSLVRGGRAEVDDANQCGESVVSCCSCSRMTRSCIDCMVGESLAFNNLLYASKSMRTMVKHTPAYKRWMEWGLAGAVQGAVRGVLFSGMPECKKSERVVSEPKVKQQ